MALEPKIDLKFDCPNLYALNDSYAYQTPKTDRDKYIELWEKYRESPAGIARALSPTIWNKFELDPNLKLGKVNLSDFFPKLKLFVNYSDPNAVFDFDLSFDPQTGVITGNYLEKIGKILKDFALLYPSEGFPGDPATPLQEIDQFYTFLMSKLNSGPALPIALSEPNTGSEELASLSPFKNKYVAGALLVIIVIISLAFNFFTLGTAIPVTIFLLAVFSGYMTMRFVNADSQHEKWATTQKLKQIAQKLTAPSQPAAAPQPVPVKIEAQNKMPIKVQAKRRSSEPAVHYCEHAVQKTAEMPREIQSPLPNQETEGPYLSPIDIDSSSDPLSLLPTTSIAPEDSALVPEAPLLDLDEFNSASAPRYVRQKATSPTPSSATSVSDAALSPVPSDHSPKSSDPDDSKDTRSVMSGSSIDDLDRAAGEETFLDSSR